MKSIVLKLMAVIAASVVVVACGNVSPEADLTCGTIDEVTVTTGPAGGSAGFYIRKSVSIADPALATDVPGRDLEVVITANHPDFNGTQLNASVCTGSPVDCDDLVSEYSGQAEMTTTEDGFLEYFLFLQIGSAATATGNIVESFRGSANTCSTGWTISSPAT